MNPKLFVPFNVRNQVINENCSDRKDIELMDQSKHYSTLTSYMKEKEIFNAFAKRRYDGLIRKSVRNFGISYDKFTKGLVDSIKDVKYTMEHPYASLNCGFIMNPSRFGNVPPAGTSLKAYWKFNEASGDIINVASTVTDNATLGSGADLQTANCTYGATGIIGDAVSFNGTTSRATAGTSLSQFNFMKDSTTIHSLSFWFKYTDGTTDRKFFHGAGTLSDYGVNLAVGAVEDLYYQLINNNATYYINYTGASYIPVEDVWHNLSMSYVYIGTPIWTARIDNASEVTSSDATGTYSTTNGTYAQRIGASSTIDDLQVLEGALDEYSVWDRELTSDDMGLLYNNGNGVELA